MTPAEMQAFFEKQERRGLIMICDFTYYSPTKVVFGKGRERETGVLVKERGAQKVLILYGGKSAQKSGLLFRVTDSLEQAGIAYAALGGVTPNPRLSFVRMGTQKAREEGIDLILAVGGGSVIDAAKAISTHFAMKAMCGTSMRERPRPKKPFLSVWSLPLLLREVNFPIHRSLQTTGPMKKGAITAIWPARFLLS